MQPRIVDISHYNKIEPNGFKLAAAAGIWGVIHKCTQGVGYVDKQYKERRQSAKDAGLLWGAYHFNTGDDVEGQVNHFILNAQALDTDHTDLLALDYESNPSGSQMAPEQMVEFLRLFEQLTGRKAVVYSGNFLKESIHKLSSEDCEYVCSHRLWLAQYGSNPKVPPGFGTYWIWQYTGDGVGPTPHQVPGIVIPGSPGIDLNAYNGSLAQLKSEWASDSNKPAPEESSQPPKDEQGPLVAIEHWIHDHLTPSIGS